VNAFANYRAPDHAQEIVWSRPEQDVAAAPEAVGLFDTPTEMAATANGTHLAHETWGDRNSGQVTP